MPRWLAILLAIPPLLLIGVAAASVEDLPALVVSKLTEGGLWTGLAAFLVLAAVMTLRPKANGQSRDAAKVK